MFDLSRVMDLVGDLVGQQAENGGFGAMSQKLEELGIDTSQLDGLAGHELFALLNEQGLDIAQLDTDQLVTLAEEAGIELPFGANLDTLLGR